VAVCADAAGRDLQWSFLETRHVHDAFKAMPVKSDCNDARRIAQLMGLVAKYGRGSDRMNG
jgi:hypothetical protein